MIAGGSPQIPLEWGWAGRALELVSGDLHVVATFADGALVGLIDGLGHGPEAALAAHAAADVLTVSPDRPVGDLVTFCHESLRKTRGAVMSLASFDARLSVMTWIGVGNVEGALLRAVPSAENTDQALLSRSGVVGYQLPLLRSASTTVSVGDTLIFVTDGVRPDFLGDPNVREDLAQAAPQAIAESILARQSKGTDDAHVVVARYVGP